MAPIQQKKFGWVRTLSARENVMAWREKRKVMRQDFEARQAVANNAFANAWTSKIDGQNTIIMQIALERIQAEAKAKTEKVLAEGRLSTEIDTAKADTKDSIFSNGSSGELDSGTKIDLNAGTVTLSNGVVIDAKTGVAKVNFIA